MTPFEMLKLCNDRDAAKDKVIREMREKLDQGILCEPSMCYSWLKYQEALYHIKAFVQSTDPHGPHFSRQDPRGQV